MLNHTVFTCTQDDSFFLHGLIEASLQNNKYVYALPYLGKVPKVMQGPNVFSIKYYLR